MKLFYKNISIQLFLFVSLNVWSQGNSIFDDSYVHEIRVTFENADFWSDLSLDYENNYPDVPYQMASIVIDGQILDSIGIRQKGFASHFGTSGKKKSLKLDFNKFVGGKEYDGLKKINLNNGVGDPALQRDKLCYDIMTHAGVKSPRTAYTRVYLNDEYWGLYLLLEQIDQTFLNDNFENSKGDLFKNMGNSELNWLGSDTIAYQGIFELKTDNEAGAWEDFVNLMRVINQSDPSEFKDEISKVFNVGRYLKVLAVDVATSNWDSYLEHGRNFYLYKDPISKKFNWIPWDYNFAIGGTFGPDAFGGGPGGGGVMDTISDPENCITITNGTCPYPASDTIFQDVINLDEFCCNTAWDDVCQGLYDDLSNGGGPGGGGPGSEPGAPEFVNQFPVNMSSSEKSLIQNLLAVPEYREQYYYEFCRLLNDNFTTDRIFPLIEKYGDLIRFDIERDSNYVWNYENFEADLEQGIGPVPGLKRFFAEQSITMDAELEEVYDCGNLESDLLALDISINEFMASNDSLSGIVDQDSESDDWIELFNNTDAEISLSNAYLTDDRDEPKKWSFPFGTKIKAGGYLIIWADKDGGQDGLHTNFKLAKTQDFIMLSDHNTVLDSLEFEEQSINMSYSRIPNGTGDFVIKTATLGENNSGATATVDVDNESIKVFPNPASQYINVVIEGALKSTRKIELTNGVGQIIVSQFVKQKHNEIQLPNVKTGIYFLTVSDEAGLLLTRKITILP